MAAVMAAVATAAATAVGSEAAATAAGSAAAAMAAAALAAGSAATAAMAAARTGRGCQGYRPHRAHSASQIPNPPSLWLNVAAAEAFVNRGSVRNTSRSPSTIGFFAPPPCCGCKRYDALVVRRMKEPSGRS